MAISSEVRKYLLRQARNGAKKRWAGKTLAEKRAHSAAMHAARYGKKRRNGA